MLRLTLIRHGNAEWKDASIPDFDRPLNKRGLSEAEGIGKILMEADLVPELLLASTAKRTQQTAELVGRMLGLAARRVKLVEPLYLARAEVILAFAQGTGPKVHHLAIVGHNPGISELARNLATTDETLAELSTGSAYTLTFTATSWVKLEGPASRAVRYDPPAKLFNLFS
ncbi:MAG: histidine phosphatase family protein [Gammaproteobacteria bacterium]